MLAFPRLLRRGLFIHSQIPDILASRLAIWISFEFLLRDIYVTYFAFRSFARIIPSSIKVGHINRECFAGLVKEKQDAHFGFWTEHRGV